MYTDIIEAKNKYVKSDVWNEAFEEAYKVIDEDLTNKEVSVVSFCNGYEYAINKITKTLNLQEVKHERRNCKMIDDSDIYEFKKINPKEVFNILQKTISYDLESMDDKGNWYHSMKNGGAKMTDEEIQKRFNFVGKMAYNMAKLKTEKENEI